MYNYNVAFIIFNVFLLKMLSVFVSLVYATVCKNCQQLFCLIYTCVDVHDNKIYIIKCNSVLSCAPRNIMQ